ncbi:MAG: enoyl-CoA hydratase [Erythrobacter sp.]
MLSTDTGTRIFAAAFSLAISAVFMATAIVPASPALFA